MLFVSLCIIMLINIGLWLIRTTIGGRYILNANKPENGSIHEKPCKFIIVIPVFQEEKRLPELIENCMAFAGENVELVFATTEKEYESRKKKNTITMIEEYEKKYSWISHYHFKGNGHMAHQLNEAIRGYIQDREDSTSVVFAVYNADSVIEENVLCWVSDAYEKQKDKEVIFQQYGRYDKNWDEVKSGILWSNMLWQTRWSIGFEIAHARMSLRDIQRDKVFLREKTIYFLNYCIGHGLFFNRSVYEKIGGFEEKSLNEDAIFGLQACLLNISIIPIPFLEEADSPDTVGSLFHQKITWIYGPGQAWLYRKLILQRRELSKKEKKRLFFLCLQLFEHAVRWILVPVLIVILLVTSIVQSVWVQSVFPMVVAFGIILFYLFGVNIYSRFFIKNRRRANLASLLRSMFGAIPQFVLHGLSGLTGLWQLFCAALGSSEIEKRKTKMK